MSSSMLLFAVILPAALDGPEVVEGRWPCRTDEVRELLRVDGQIRKVERVGGLMFFSTSDGSGSAGKLWSAKFRPQEQLEEPIILADNLFLTGSMADDFVYAGRIVAAAGSGFSCVGPECSNPDPPPSLPTSESLGGLRESIVFRTVNGGVINIEVVQVHLQTSDILRGIVVAGLDAQATVRYDAGIMGSGAVMAIASWHNGPNGANSGNPIIVTIPDLYNTYVYIHNGVYTGGAINSYPVSDTLVLSPSNPQVTDVHLDLRTKNDNMYLLFSARLNVGITNVLFTPLKADLVEHASGNYLVGNISLRYPGWVETLEFGQDVSDLHEYYDFGHWQTRIPNVNGGVTSVGGVLACWAERQWGTVTQIKLRFYVDFFGSPVEPVRLFGEDLVISEETDNLLLAPQLDTYVSVYPADVLYCRLYWRQTQNSSADVLSSATVTVEPGIIGGTGAAYTVGPVIRIGFVQTGTGYDVMIHSTISVCVARDSEGGITMYNNPLNPVFEGNVVAIKLFSDGSFIDNLREQVSMARRSDRARVINSTNQIGELPVDVPLVSVIMAGGNSLYDMFTSHWRVRGPVSAPVVELVEQGREEEFVELSVANPGCAADAVVIKRLVGDISGPVVEVMEDKLDVIGTDENQGVLQYRDISLFGGRRDYQVVYEVSFATREIDIYTLDPESIGLNVADNRFTQVITGYLKKPDGLTFKWLNDREISTGSRVAEVSWDVESGSASTSIIEAARSGEPEFNEIIRVEAGVKSGVDILADEAQVNSYRVYSKDEFGLLSVYSDVVSSSTVTEVSVEDVHDGNSSGGGIAGAIKRRISSCFGSIRNYEDRRRGGDSAACYVATSAAGGAKMAIVERLKWTRDHGLKRGAVGRLSVDIYQAGSPHVATEIGTSWIIQVILAGIAAVQGNTMLLFFLAVLGIAIRSRSFIKIPHLNKL